jgi:response regulator RpfG family c-di-GMP phosphodiesterase
METLKPKLLLVAMLRVGNLIEKARLTAKLHVQNEALNTLNTSLESQVQERTAGLSQANEQLGKTYLSIIKAFSSMVELRVPHLAGHGRRVADLVQKMAESMRLEKEEVRRLMVASLIHDLGFLVLPDSITTKAVEMLGSESLENYRRHPVVGATSLASMGKELELVAHIIRAHHEWYDGRGYPDGLKGDAIPLGARMLTLADAYDDLITGHTSGTRLSPQRALKVMEDKRGSQFDPALLDVFKLAQEGTTLDTQQVLALRSAQLEVGMVLQKQISSRQGMALLAPEQALTSALIEKIRAYEKETGVSLLVFVRQPAVAS